MGEFGTVRLIYHDKGGHCGFIGDKSSFKYDSNIPGQCRSVFVVRVEVKACVHR